MERCGVFALASGCGVSASPEARGAAPTGASGALLDFPQFRSDLLGRTFASTRNRWRRSGDRRHSRPGGRAVQPCSKTERGLGSPRYRSIVRCEALERSPVSRRFVRLSLQSVYSSKVERSPSGSPWARAFSTRRMILPERVLGSLSTNWITSGLAMGPRCVETCLRRSSFSSSVGSLPILIWMKQ